MKSKVVAGLLGFAFGAVVGAVGMHVQMKMNEGRTGPAPTVPGTGGTVAA